MLVNFIGCYAITGVALAATIWFGKKRRLLAHAISVVAFVIGFIATIGFAELVGETLNLDERAKTIHMPFAFLGSLLSVPPIVTGLLVWRSKVTVRVHRWAIGAFLVAFVLASVTGGYMLAVSTPRAT